MTDIVTQETQGMSMSNVGRAIIELYMGCHERKMPIMRPVYVEGAPGCGKTYTVNDVAKKLSKLLGVNVDVYAQLTSCLDPVDITGAPYAIKVGGKETYAAYLPLEWAWLCSVEYEKFMQIDDPDFKAPPALLFFDDLAAAHFQSQTAFFKGVHEGMWGSLRQRPNVMVIGAGNRVTDNAGANDMPTALANRFCILKAAPTTQDWLKWATSTGNVHPLCIGFIRQFTGDLNTFNTDVANSSEKAFASSRTWEMLSDFLHMGRVGIEDPIFSNMVMGWIGGGIGLKFLGYMRNTTSCVPPAEIVKGPKKVDVPSGKNLDALFATISSLEYFIKQDPIGPKKAKVPHWKAGLQYALREEMLPEAATILARGITMIIEDAIPAEEKAEMYCDDSYEKLWDILEDVLDTEIE